MTPILRYDPIGRLAHGANTATERRAWSQTVWDENDAVAGAPWLARMQAGSPAEQRAATLSLAHADTATRVHFTPTGAVYASVGDLGGGHLVEVRAQLDVLGRQIAVIDARATMLHRQSLDLMSRRMRLVRADAGPWDATQGRRAVDVASDAEGARTVFSASGALVWLRDERGHTVRRTYDELDRPREVYHDDGSTVRVVESSTYGESISTASAMNLRTRVHQMRDAAGVLTHERYDFAGRLLSSSRQLPASSSGPGEIFRTQRAYDALDRVIAETTPDATTVHTTYDASGHRATITANIRASNTATPLLAGADYNARGQRVAVDRPGTRTTYTYDSLTFALQHQRVTRQSNGEILQDLRYTRDAVGHIVDVEDAASHGNGAVSAGGRFVYDALYRLTSAEGREHPSTTLGGRGDITPVVHPNDLSQLRRYTERYEYDDAGNITELTHAPFGGAQWSREYAYSTNSNRLVQVDPSASSAAFQYDELGSLTRLTATVSTNSLPSLEWDHAARLVSAATTVGLPGNVVRYAYDASGGRVAKTYEHNGVTEARVYVGAYEVYQRRQGGAVVLERQTLHVADEDYRFVIIETETTAASAVSRLRFQLANPVESATMEVDETGAVASYEEYTPFGETTWQMRDASLGGVAKRYRYMGKERDEEPGLYAIGARYYAAWLGRWVSCDPIAAATAFAGYVPLAAAAGVSAGALGFLQRDPSGYVDSVNVYAAMANDPVNNRDPTGEISVSAGLKKAYPRAARAILRAAERLSARLYTGFSLYGGADKTLVDKVLRAEEMAEPQFAESSLLNKDTGPQVDIAWSWSDIREGRYPCGHYNRKLRMLCILPLISLQPLMQVSTVTPLLTSPCFMRLCTICAIGMDYQKKTMPEKLATYLKSMSGVKQETAATDLRTGLSGACRGH